MSKLSAKNDEALRRLLVGDLRRLFRHRYGATLPPDDAGRDDLCLLLQAISLDPRVPAEKMAREIEVLGPWMDATEAKQLIDDLMNLPLCWRKLPPKALGAMVRLTNRERERLRLWRIAPVDMTADELIEQRKAKRRTRARLTRRKAGAAARADYLAKSKSKSKPWEAEGISRTTWYRRRETSPSPAILSKEDTGPVSVTL